MAYKVKALKTVKVFVTIQQRFSLLSTNSFQWYSKAKFLPDRSKSQLVSSSVLTWSFFGKDPGSAFEWSEDSIRRDAKRRIDPNDPTWLLSEKLATILRKKYIYPHYTNWWCYEKQTKSVQRENLRKAKYVHFGQAVVVKRPTTMFSNFRIGNKINYYKLKCHVNPDIAFLSRFF